jgi:hypothetical protein
LGPRLEIGSGGKKKVTVYQIPSGCRYKDYRVKEEALENVSFLEIYYVEADNEEQVRRLEALKNGRLIAGKVGASVNALFGYTVDLGSFEAGANSLIVKDRESIQVRRSKHAALVVEGGTKKGNLFPLSQAKSSIKVILEVYLEKYETPPQDIPSSPISAHNHVQPSPYATYPPGNVLPAFVTASLPAVSSSSQEQLRRDYEDQLYAVRASREKLRRDCEDQLCEVRASREQLRRDYEDQLYEVRASRDRAKSAHQTAASALEQKEQEHQRLVQEHAAAQAALRQELATAETSLKQKERDYERLSKDHAALQKALKLEREQSAAVVQEHERQLARQASLYQTAEMARQTAETSLKQKERDYERLVEAYQQQVKLPTVYGGYEAFGSKAWSQYFGEVGGEPSLPADINTTLNSACPFWLGKQVKDTHLLVLIPAKVNGKPFSLDLLGELIQHPRGGGYATKYAPYGDLLKEAYGTQSPARPYWVLMTRDVLEGSRNERYASQKALVAGHAERTKLPYELPGALEAATVILSHYVRSGERLYADAPWTYTRCREFQKGNFVWTDHAGNEHPFDTWYAVVGGFSSGGLRVSSFSIDGGSGVAGLRKF